MGVHWKPHPATPCADGKARTVYIRGEFAPFVGWMATPDTVWTCPAYIRHKGKRVAGYMCAEAGAFRPYDREAAKLEA